MKKNSSQFIKFICAFFSLSALLIGCKNEANEAGPAASPSGSEKPAAASVLTLYSGRNEKLVGPLIKDFEKETGIQVKVRYGETPQLAALLLEEGGRSPADVYLAQDAGALGALSKAKRLGKLPAETLAKVKDERFKSHAGEWVGISGRARVLAYNTDKLKPEQLPSSVLELTDPKWKGKIGWAPTNASFQAFVTALRVLKSEQEAASWLKGIQANEARKYKNNTAIVEALSRGEIEVGLVNHYYLFAMKKGKTEAFPVANHYLAKDDPGALINVAGVAILQGIEEQRPGSSAVAQKFVEFLLSPKAQEYFAHETYEYPLVEGVRADEGLKPIGEIGSPKLDLSQLDNLQETVRLLQEQEVL